MKIVRVVAAVALVFLAVSAIMGAVPLIKDPSGQSMGMPPGILQHTPFHSYLIPGIVLLVSQGLMGLAVLTITVFCKRGYGQWIGFQGCMLFGWITIQVILVRGVIWLHYVYWGLGLLLIGCGWALYRKERVGEAPAVTRSLAAPSTTPRHP
jgi:hypothetical protein